MWLLLNNAMVSIVKKGDEPEDSLTVRARVSGDLTRFLGPVTELYTADGDYPYRAICHKLLVQAAMRDAVDSINYSNFKDSIPKKDVRRRMAYSEVWDVLITHLQTQYTRTRYNMTNQV